MEFDRLIETLERVCCLKLAEPWDNVGLLVQPSSLYGAGAKTKVARVLLCEDLTLDVVREAASVGAKVVVSYHPVIWSAMKRLTPSAGTKQHVVCEALEHGIAVFCPHSALDAAKGGMNDWLAAGLGKGTTVPIVPCKDDPEIGAGRILTLETPVAVDELGRRLRTRMGGDCHVRIAASTRPKSGAVRSVAICVGSGADLFGSVDVDALVTGELSHHFVLDQVERGVHCVISEHTSTERGFLAAVLKPWLDSALATSGVTIDLSTADREIIRILP